MKAVIWCVVAAAEARPGGREGRANHRSSCPVQRSSSTADEGRTNHYVHTTASHRRRERLDHTTGPAKPGRIGPT